ncbi:MAG: TIGR04086 family membrane protein [Lachnospiraceae bacterium]|nr:TIGR04086 family membrane protein [Lachnospiraceae bacterium]
MEQNRMFGQKIFWLVKGMIFAYAVTGILLMLLAFLLYRMDLSEQMVSMGIMAIYTVSCFVSGFYIGHKRQNKKYLWGLLEGLLYFVLLLLISYMAGPGKSTDMQHILISLGLCLAGGTLGGMLS